MTGPANKHYIKEIFIRFFYFFQTLLKNKMVLAKKALKSTLLKTKKINKKLRKIIFEVFLFIFLLFLYFNRF
ncbi:hypothetical protein EJW95_08105 [Enterococcus faecalis]|nr:hypothetical protein [Enterococcus faecalis]